MSIFGDLFGFVTSVILGKQDGAKNFMEPINMAERYMRWGNERGDIRDFNSALEELSACKDRDAPTPDDLCRKYNCLCATSVSAVELLGGKHREQMSVACDSEQAMKAELEQVRRSIEVSRDRIDALKHDGSLIKAKEEERRLEEHQLKRKHLESSLESGVAQSQMAGSYEKFSDLVSPILQRLEQALVELQMNDSLPQELGTQICKQVQTSLNDIQEQLKSLAPGADSSAEDQTESETESEPEG